MPPISSIPGLPSVLRLSDKSRMGIPALYTLALAASTCQDVVWRGECSHKRFIRIVEARASSAVHDCARSNVALFCRKNLFTCHHTAPDSLKSDWRLFHQSFKRTVKTKSCCENMICSMAAVQVQTSGPSKTYKFWTNQVHDVYMSVSFIVLVDLFTFQNSSVQISIFICPWWYAKQPSKITTMSNDSNQPLCISTPYHFIWSAVHTLIPVCFIVLISLWKWLIISRLWGTPL
jgi:hypothetical protein